MLVITLWHKFPYHVIPFRNIHTCHQLQLVKLALQHRVVAYHHAVIACKLFKLSLFNSSVDCEMLKHLYKAHSFTVIDSCIRILDKIGKQSCESKIVICLYIVIVQNGHSVDYVDKLSYILIVHHNLLLLFLFFLDLWSYLIYLIVCVVHNKGFKCIPYIETFNCLEQKDSFNGSCWTYVIYLYPYIVTCLNIWHVICYRNLNSVAVFAYTQTEWILYICNKAYNLFTYRGHLPYEIIHKVGYDKI